MDETINLQNLQVTKLFKADLKNVNLISKNYIVPMCEKTKYNAGTRHSQTTLNKLINSVAEVLTETHHKLPKPSKIRTQ